MKLIVGLGNPGRQYLRSRHNIGFRIADALADRWSVPLTRMQHEALAGSTVKRNQKIVILKPQTFMNLSGASVAAAVRFYKAQPEDLLVLLDDMALPLGQLRLRATGSAGGHNGLADIIDRLGANEFARLRVGIGAAHPGHAVAHVLGDFTEDEETIVQNAVDHAADATECWLHRGISTAMNQYNLRQTQDNNEQSQ